MKNRILYSVLALTVIAGCAKRADSVVPVNIPIAAYTSLDCPSLAQELIAERGKMNILVKKQNQAATGDAIGVFLVVLPIASITGQDGEGNLAVSKGKVLSIENAIRSKSCDPTQAITSLVAPVAGAIVQ